MPGTPGILNMCVPKSLYPESRREYERKNWKELSLHAAYPPFLRRVWRRCFSTSGIALWDFHLLPFNSLGAVIGQTDPTPTPRLLSAHLWGLFFEHGEARILLDVEEEWYCWSFQSLHIPIIPLDWCKVCVCVCGMCVWNNKMFRSLYLFWRS